FAASRIAAAFRYDFAACGGPISTASSASSTASDFASAWLCTCTVRMPSSCAARMMRTAISPRLAMSSFLIAIGLVCLAFHVSDRLSGLNRFLILDVELRDFPRHLRFYLVEGLHHLNQSH